MSEHTKTPWKAEAGIDPQWTVANCDPDNPTYLALTCSGNDEANARFIVRAVNSHEALVETLEAAEKAEGVLINEWADFWDVAPQSMIDALMHAQTLRNAALELARKEQ